METNITIDQEEVERIHQLLIDNEVVAGPPDLLVVVQTLWPELAHKVKPPLKQMH
jgi:hypothetical protein